MGQAVPISQSSTVRTQMLPTSLHARPGVRPKEHLMIVLSNRACGPTKERDEASSLATAGEFVAQVQRKIHQGRAQCSKGYSEY